MTISLKVLGLKGKCICHKKFSRALFKKLFFNKNKNAYE